LPTGQVSLLFSDIEGSTRLLDRLGDDYGDVLAEHRRLLREIWMAHGGVEVDTEGDAFFVAFPLAAEAVDAAADAQRVIAGAEQLAGLKVRIGGGAAPGPPIRSRRSVTSRAIKLLWPSSSRSRWRNFSTRTRPISQSR
jgi:class 3 adenylate cyclase